MSRPSLVPALLLATFAAGVSVGRRTEWPPPAAPAAPIGLVDTAARVFELRTYTTAPGRLPALQRRFREHTLGIFARHGMTNVGYWTPEDSTRAPNTLVYLLAHPSREAAARNWAAFGQDPEWRRVQAASEADGKIVEKVESVFLDPTDYSPLR
ncbi:MAG TPA: NIPSNAP family protein [Gemmatirosa sp.]